MSVEVAERVRVGDLRQFVVEVLGHQGVPSDDGGVVADALLYADLRGITSHGLALFPGYLQRLVAGSITAQPAISVVEDFGAIGVLDGGNALGPVAARRGMGLALDKAAQFGVGAVGVRNGNHFGAAGYYAALALERGMLGLATSNAAAIMAPPGGTTPVVGNNPLAVAAPGGQEPPIVVDFALSVVSYGRIRRAAERGERIPATWATRADGTPTADPAMALAGLLAPFGGHKGFGLAVAVELLTAALTGAALSWEVAAAQQRGQPENRGHFCLAIAPERFQTAEAFHRRMTVLANRIRRSGSTARVPGQRAEQDARTAHAHGIRLSEVVRAELEALGTAAGIGPLAA